MAERDIDAATLAQLTANGAWIVFLVDLMLDGAPQYVGAGFIGRVTDTTEDPPITYTGLGEFGGFTIGAETPGGLASGASYSLSGIDPSSNTEITGFRDALGTDLQTRVQGRQARLRVAAISEAFEVIGRPPLLRDDTMDSLTFLDTGNRLELVLTSEYKTVDFKRIRKSTASSVDHKRLHPGEPEDEFYDDDRWRRTDIRWGQKKTSGDPTTT